MLRSRTRSRGALRVVNSLPSSKAPDGQGQRVRTGQRRDATCAAELDGHHLLVENHTSECDRVREHDARGAGAATAVPGFAQIFAAR